MMTKIMSIDCEYNQPSHKTTEIGAIIFEIESGVSVASFRTFVNPKETLNPDIIQLTGITDNDVQNAPDIVGAFEALQLFASQHTDLLQNPLVWGSGVRNDSDMLYKEYLANKDVVWENGPPPNFMGYRVMDAKTVYQSYQAIRGKTVRGGLQKACSTVGIDFIGQPHRALNDAYNTFKIWHHLMKRFKAGFDIISMTQNLYKKEGI